MKTFLGSSLAALVVFLSAATPSLQSAEPTDFGDIRIGKVEGEAFVARESAPVGKLNPLDEQLGRQRPDVAVGQKTEAKVGHILRQGEEIQTGPNSRVVLLFSNGTAISVEQNSVFSVKKFLQDPFDPASYNIASAKTEPSRSVTELTLKKGTVLGDVRKLNDGSSMKITTPLGTAGIRGTRFVISVSVAPNGSFVGTLTVETGRVDFVDSTGTTKSVTAGEQISISGNLGQTFNFQDPQNLTPEEQEAVAQRFREAFGENFFVDGGVSTTSSPLGDLGDDSGFGQGAIDVGTLPGGGGGGGGSGSGGAQNPPSISTGSPTPTPTPSPTAPPVPPPYGR